MRLAFLLLLTSCGAASPATETTPATSPRSANTTPDAGTEVTCSAGLGPVALRLPSGVSIGDVPNPCTVMPTGATVETTPWAFRVEVLSVGDAGPERVLAREPDGARAWFESVAPVVAHLAEGELAWGGGVQRYDVFQVNAPDVRMPLMVTRAVVGERVLLVVAGWPEAEADRAQVLETIATISLR